MLSRLVKNFPSNVFSGSRQNLSALKLLGVILLVLFAANLHASQRATVLTDPKELSYPSEICTLQTSTDDIKEALQSKSWRCHGVDSMTIPYSGAHNWFRVKYDLKDSKARWAVSYRFGYSMYDSVTAYVRNEDGKLIEYHKIGSDTRISERESVTAELTHPLPKNVGEYGEIFVHVKSVKAILFAPVFSSYESLEYEMVKIANICFSTAGFMFAIVLFTTAYSYKMNDMIGTNVCLVFGTVVVVIWQMVVTGVGYRYFWGEYPLFQQKGWMTFACFGAGILHFFCHQFLKSSYNPSYLKPLLYVNGSAEFFIAICSRAYQSEWWGIVASSHNLMAPWIVMAISTYVAIAIDRSVKYMAMGGVAIAMGASIVSAQTLALIPVDWMISPMLLMPVMLGFFAIAIADRVSERRKKILSSLEETVANQTQELRTQNTALEKLVEDQAYAIEQQINFFSSANHNIRVPLNALTIRVQLLRVGIGGMSIDQVDHELNNVEIGVSRIGAIVNEHLQQYSGTVSSDKATIQQMNVCSAIQSACEMFVPVANNKNMTITTECAKELWVWGKNSLVFEILENLISNACKYCQDGAHIIVGAERSMNRGFVNIYVDDDGPGLTEEDEKHPFKASGSKQKIQESGQQSCGIGLYVTFISAAKMKGRMEYERSSRGGGRFTLVLNEVSDDDHSSLETSNKEFHAFMARPV
jgi:signal transduction histidine kinase